MHHSEKKHSRTKDLLEHCPKGQKGSDPPGFLQELPEEAVKKMDRFEKLDPEQEKVYAKKCFANIKAILGD